MEHDFAVDVPLGQVSVRLFGIPAAINARGEPAFSLTAQPKRMLLLAYLASCGRGAAVPRDRLLFLFWPTSDEQSARNSLNQSVHFIRRSLGRDVILTEEPDSVRLNPGRIDFDLWSLECERRPGSELGEFMEGAAANGAPELQEWLDSMRRHRWVSDNQMSPEEPRERPDTVPLSEEGSWHRFAKRSGRPSSGWNHWLAVTAASFALFVGSSALELPVQARANILEIGVLDVEVVGAGELGISSAALFEQMIRELDGALPHSIVPYSSIHSRTRLAMWLELFEISDRPDQFFRTLLRVDSAGVFAIGRRNDYLSGHVIAQSEVWLQRESGERPAEFEARIAKTLLPRLIEGLDSVHK